MHAAHQLDEQAAQKHLEFCREFTEGLEESRLESYCALALGGW